MGLPLKQIGLILGLALGPALLTGWFHPNRPSWNPDRLKEGEVTLSQVLEWGDSVLWVDARSRRAFEKQHIPGAVLLNEDEWEELIVGVMRRWKPGVKIVVYCDSRECQASHQVANRLKQQGVGSVFVLHGGVEAWERGP